MTCSIFQEDKEFAMNWKEKVKRISEKLIKIIKWNIFSLVVYLLNALQNERI